MALYSAKMDLAKKLNNYNTKTNSYGYEYQCTYNKGAAGVAKCSVCGTKERSAGSRAAASALGIDCRK